MRKEPGTPADINVMVRIPPTNCPVIRRIELHIAASEKWRKSACREAISLVLIRAPTAYDRICGVPSRKRRRPQRGWQALDLRARMNTPVHGPLSVGDNVVTRLMPDAHLRRDRAGWYLSAFIDRSDTSRLGTHLSPPGWHRAIRVLPPSARTAAQATELCAARHLGYRDHSHFVVPQKCCNPPPTPCVEHQPIA